MAEYTVGQFQKNLVAESEHVKTNLGNLMSSSYHARANPNDFVSEHNHVRTKSESINS